MRRIEIDVGPFVPAAIFFIFVSLKTVAIVLLLIATAIVVRSLFVRKQLTRVLARIGFVLAVFAIVSPVDIHVRRTSNATVRFLPVVYQLGSNVAVRRLKQSGAKENRDFVVLTYPHWPNEVRYSVMIGISGGDGRELAEEPPSPSSAPVDGTPRNHPWALGG